MKQRKVIIIGAGASGMVAAISAAREGADVILIEHKDRVGKKILSTGNGRCNLTNEYMDETCFRGDDTSIVAKVLAQFGVQDTLHFFEELGVIWKSRQGYVYPISDQASTILDVLRMELERLPVSVLLDTKISSVQKNSKEFVICTNRGTYYGDALILATGSKASSVLGSDGSGYRLAKQFGHHLSPVVPALVQLKGNSELFKQVAGVRTQAKVTAYIDNQIVCSDTGELQLTNYGISGIPVFQISRYVSKALYEKKSAKVELDFMPSMSDSEFENYVFERLDRHRTKTTSDFFVGVFHKKIIAMLLKCAGISQQNTIQNVSAEKIREVIYLSKHFSVEIFDTNGFEQAQICAGGVKTSEINPETMESVSESNLYLVGEILDIDGICGGYNLQWAWSTGFIAGKNAAKGRML